MNVFEKGKSFQMSYKDLFVHINKKNDQQSYLSNIIIKIDAPQPNIG